MGDAENIKITQMIDDMSSIVFNAQRKATFAKWTYDKVKDAVCTGERLADAGFYSTATRGDPSAATCAFCLKEMIFDPEDDPWEEHVSHCPQCFFVIFNQQQENLLTMKQFLELVAFRKANMMGKWCEDQMKQFNDAVTYVKNMKPK